MDIFSKLTCAFGSILTALAFIVCGFLACCIPYTTETLSEMYGGSETTPFTTEDLGAAAVAMRDYTLGDADRKSLDNMVQSINTSSDTPYADATEAQLEAAPDNYRLSEEAVAHLDDCHNLFHKLPIPFICLGVLWLMTMLHILVRISLKSFGGTLVGGGALCIACFLALAIWAGMDFNGMFDFLHHLFFQDGTWYFPEESLIIAVFPTAFWMGMGAVWLATALLLSILAIVFGRKIYRKQKQRMQ